MIKKNIAFVTVFDSAITNAQLSMELSGDLNSWFIVPTRQNKKDLITFGVPAWQILDLSVNRNVFKKSIYNIEVNETLAFFEDSRLPISSIIAASRTCNKESLDNLEVYMANVLVKIDAFIKDHNIDWVITEPSDIVQMLSQLVCWKRGIYFGQITLARHPSNRIIFATDCTEEGFHNLTASNKVSADDVTQWLIDFRERNMRPAYYSRTSNYRSFLSLGWSFIKRFPKIFKELLSLSELNDLRTERLLWRYIQDLSRKYLKINTTCVVDTKTLKYRKYAVYFLHVQPERSIDVMAPNYVEQIEIIKQIRRSLPWNIDLLVKDHPASDGAQTFRFYSDLKKIHGVKLVSSSVDSRSISMNSLLVATVSGTVAYEMALLNKPALMFSKVFFSILPSIYIYETPELLANYLRNLINCEDKNLNSNDVAILHYLENLYKNSVISDWDGFYGVLQRPALLSISELIRQALLNR
jgi:Capsule polysaccharide biosynthesis protein